ncbi:hypothetical protein EUX98_g5923 [Antrodiella citrinella]|uniref:Uncharacterized protein n=1 Tax=Antrodiella citrinella TaxID=2447956 RepID=A0A4S4MS64_9APHY|nr:hypothetical protein EUX98_g5923 [Antrodiella citrinella]
MVKNAAESSAKMPATPTSILSDALGVFTKAANLAVATAEKQSAAEVARANVEAEEARRERDEAVDAMNAMRLDKKEWQRRVEGWKSSVDKSDMTIEHQNETIAQLREEANQWKGQLLRYEDTARREAQDWKEQYLRAEQERIQLAARVDELVNEQLAWNTHTNAHNAAYASRSHPDMPNVAGPSTSRTPRQKTADVRMDDTPTTRPSAAPRASMSQPSEVVRVIRRVQAVIEVPVKEESEDEDDQLRSDSAASEYNPPLQKKTPQKGKAKRRLSIKSRKPADSEEEDDDYEEPPMRRRAQASNAYSDDELAVIDAGWADIFAKAKAGDTHLQAVLARYSKMIAVRREKEHIKALMREEFEFQEKLRHRPVLTGGYLRPSISNPPLPRMKPQPAHLSGMIHKRRQATVRQWAAVGEADVLLQDLKHEKEFEENLIKTAGKTRVDMELAYTGNRFHDWVAPIIDVKKMMNERIKLGFQRQSLPYPPEMLAQIKQARREKIANKTREYQREARGEILRRTIRRANKGPPAHVLAKMTPLQKHLDKVSRSSVSEVGYVGWAKRKLGWKLRNPDAWKVEIGKEENQEYLARMAGEIRQENERRRREAESIIQEG